MTRGILGYTGKVDIAEYKDVEVKIKGRSRTALEFGTSVVELVTKNIHIYKNAEATEEALSALQDAKSGCPIYRPPIYRPR